MREPRKCPSCEAPLVMAIKQPDPANHTVLIDAFVYGCSSQWWKPRGASVYQQRRPCRHPWIDGKPPSRASTPKSVTRDSRAATNGSGETAYK